MLEGCLDNLLCGNILSEEEMGFYHMVPIVVINYKVKEKLQIDLCKQSMTYSK